MISTLHRFDKGASVAVDSSGLNGAKLTVDRRERDGHYALRFANGNAVPGFYHDALVRAA